MGYRIIFPERKKVKYEGGKGKEKVRLLPSALSLFLHFIVGFGFAPSREGLYCASAKEQSITIFLVPPIKCVSLSSSDRPSAVMDDPHRAKELTLPS